jgi:hypothetical protein
VLYFGVVRQDYCLFCCDQSCAHIPTPTPHIEQGRRVFSVHSGFQFVIVIEAAPGQSGAQPGKSLTPVPPSNRADLQIQSTTNLGSNPTTKVCDTGPASQGGGGIPRINPPSFAEDDPIITDALNDFACRFQVFNFSGPCTKVDATQDPRLITPNAPVTTTQFCDLVSSVAAFPPGDTRLTVKVRGEDGNLGQAKEIVIRVPTPTRTRTPTPTP